MTDHLLDQVARAICKADGNDPPDDTVEIDGVTITLYKQEYFLNLAKAAIEALGPAQPTLAQFFDAETTHVRIRTAVLAALAALRQHKITNGRSAPPEQAATVITACVIEALRPIPTPPDPGDEKIDEWDQQIEQDAKSGKLDGLLAESEADFREGRVRKVAA